MDAPNLDTITYITKDFSRKGSLLNHMNSLTDNFAFDIKPNLNNYNRYNKNFYKLGNKFSELLFKSNYDNNNNDFVCYRPDQISLIIFQMVYFRYIKHHEDLKNLLNGFLQSFFINHNNEKEKNI